jgi:hypothetical protein
MSPAVPRRLLASLLVLLVLGAAGWAGWRWLGGYVVGSVLRLAGASAIHWERVAATPRHIEIDGLRFRLGPQAFAARRVTLQRERWWTASLGEVRVEGASTVVVLDGSDTNPWKWATYDDGGLGNEAVQLPFTSLDLDGELVVRMAALPDQVISLRLEGRPRSATSWIGSLVAEGPGFRLAGGGTLLRGGQELDFQVHSALLDLAAWSSHLNRLIVLPGGPWELGGRLTGVAEGRVTARRFAATARVDLHDGRMRAGARDVEAGGVEARLEFSDLWKYRTRTGTFRMDTLRVGRLVLRDAAGGLGLWGARQVSVDGATFSALGGRVRMEPFKCFLDQREVVGSLQVEGLDLGQVLALTEGVGGFATGRVDGALRVRIQSDGARIDTGELTLTPGVPAALQADAFAVLRTGAAMDDASRALLRELRGAPLRLRLDTLRLDIRPEGLPLGTSARLGVAGLTPEGAAAGFVLTVNGSLERFLHILP